MTTPMIPEDAVNLRASCFWCEWQQPIPNRLATISHTCYALHDLAPVTRAPAIRLEWTVYREIAA